MDTLSRCCINCGSVSVCGLSSTLESNLSVGEGIGVSSKLCAVGKMSFGSTSLASSLLCGTVSGLRTLSES